jgi:hypothetical protein
MNDNRLIGHALIAYAQELELTTTIFWTPNSDQELENAKRCRTLAQTYYVKADEEDAHGKNPTQPAGSGNRG